jgi:hypothetical protein
LILGLAIGISLGVIVIVLGIVLFILWRRRSTDLIDKNSPVKAHTESIM